MGRAKQNKPRRERPLPAVTREPLVPPQGWPGSVVRCELTTADEDECVRVTIHGVEHLLHATTARALSNALLEKLDEYNAGIQKILADPRLRAVQQDVIAAVAAPGQEPSTLEGLIV